MLSSCVDRSVYPRVRVIMQAWSVSAIRSVQPQTGRSAKAADDPDAADKTYGFALSASLSRAFPCAPG